MPTSHSALLLSALITATGSAQQTPRTVAEASGYQQTSRAADVARFIEQCEQLPHGGRLAAGSMGSSHEGRRIQLVRAECLLAFTLYLSWIALQLLDSVCCSVALHTCSCP